MAALAGNRTSVWTRTAIAAVLVAGCRLGAVPSATAPQTQSPTAVSSPTASPTGAGPTASPEREHIEFVRWLSSEIELVTEPGGDIGIEGTGDEPIAAVLDRRIVDGVEWIRVQVGRGYAQDSVVNGWAPYAADVTVGGRTVHVEPVYEAVVPLCPEAEPNVRDLDGMLPLQSLYCLGSRTLTFSPVQVRDEGTADAGLVTGSPSWLALQGRLAMYWLPERREMGSIRVYVDPGSGIKVPQHTWVEVKGHLDDPAARQCTRTSSAPQFHLASREEAVLLCRGRFVVTDVRALAEAEIPAEVPHATPGPQPERAFQVAVRRVDGPLPVRYEAATVWSGTEMLTWGGWEWGSDWGAADRVLDDGVAYDPAAGKWRDLAAGPLAGRGAATATWTGSEMLIWGGYRRGDIFSDGAAYDPAADAWRTIAPAPLRWDDGTGSIWTGSEWWLAVSRRGHVRVAAYAPVSDSWRLLPEVDAPEDTRNQLIWTGVEMLLVNSATGLFRLTSSESEWTAATIDFNGPFAWTGSVLLGSKFEDLATDPFDWDPWSYPVAWDPGTSSRVEIPLPPRGVDAPVWTGHLVAYFDDRLALDMASAAWVDLIIDIPAGIPTFRSGASVVWADDRLIVWGGTSGCPGYMPGYEVGYELIPDWPGADPVALGTGSIVSWSPGMWSPQSAIGTTIAAC